jgi:Fe-S oxidoreductase
MSGKTDKGVKDKKHHGGKSVEDLLQETNVYYCLDCGKCSGSCPVSTVKADFSPRRIVESTAMEPDEKSSTDKTLWDCLTCHKCYNFCPEDVNFPLFVREQRKRALKHDNLPVLNHGGITNSVAHAMANLDLKQERLAWVGDAKIAEKGDILLFTGCMVHFDLVFEPLGVDGGKNILYNAVRIMNKAGIMPVVMKDEVCCGHDQLWGGEEEAFIKLMERNLKAIKKTGAKKIVTVCPEGANTLKKDYAKYGNAKLEVVHITEFLAELLREGKIKLKQSGEKVTYQDPCRLSRYLNVLDAPRELINAVNPEGFVEMEDSRELSTCCGTTLFRGCDSFSEAIRDTRLKQAGATGAETILTACPKCQIHMRCTLSGKCEERDIDPKLKVKDIVTFVAENLEGGV